MQETVNKIALGLIVAGSILSLGRDYWSRLMAMLYARIKQQEQDPKLKQVFAMYFMLTGMIFTIIGLLGMFNIITF